MTDEQAEVVSDAPALHRALQSELVVSAAGSLGARDGAIVSI